MGAEVDSIEIQVETEAKGANRSLSNMERKLTRIAERLTEVSALASGLGNVGNFDIKGLVSANSQLGTMLENIGNVGKRPAKPRIDRSDIKYATKDLDALFKKFENVGKNIDVSNMGFPELQKELAITEKRITQLTERLNKKLAIENVEHYGKAYESLVYDIQKATNHAETLKKAMQNIGEPADVSITRGSQSDSIESPGKNDFFEDVASDAKVAKKEIAAVNQEVQQLQKTSLSRGILDSFKLDDEGKLSNLKNLKNVISDSMSGFAQGTLDAFRLNDSGTFPALDKAKAILNKKGMSEIPVRFVSDTTPLDNAIARIENEIARVKQSISDNISIGKIDGIDEDIQDLKILEKDLRQYQSIAGSLSTVKDGVRGIKKETNGISTKKFDEFGNKLSKLYKKISKVLHPLRTLKGLMKGSGGSSGNNGMSMGRMIGSSIMFSSIFGAITKIKEAVKEGSDNLVQYSTEYNNSISGMVSSLLYLKNAWAVAFAPIINVVGPYVSAFVDMMASALNKLGQLMAALTGKGFVVQAKKAWKDYGKTLTDTGSSAKKAGDDAKKAAKDFQTYTLGIDELNIQPQTTDSSSSGDSSSGSGSGGSYTGPDVSDMFETIEVPNSMKNLADKIKESIKNSDFTDIGTMLSDKLSGALESINWQKIYGHADNFGKDLATFLNGLITPRLFYDVGATVANSINTALHAENAFAINFDWKNLGDSMASSIKGFFENWDAKLTAETFSHFVSGIIDGIAGFVDGLTEDETWKTIGQKLVDLICGVDYGDLTWSLTGLFDAFAKAVVQWPVDLATGIGEELVEKLFGKNFTDETQKKFSEGVGDISSSVTWLLDQINPLTQVVSNLNLIKDAITNHGDEAVKVLSEKWDSVKAIFSAVPDWFNTIFTGAYNGIKNAWAFVGTWAADKWDSVKKPFAVAKQWFTDKFLSAYNGIKAVWAYVGSWANERYNSIIQPFKNIPSYFRSAFQSAYNAVKAIWDGIGGYFRGIANKIISPIQKAVNGVIGGINWVLGQVGSSKTLPEWTNVPRFASGTNGLPQDTLGMVNDQKGNTYKELIVPPNGKPFIPEGRNVVLPMKKGTKIMPAGQTAELMSGMPKFAGGIGKFFGNAWDSITSFTGNVMDYISHPSKIMKMAIDKFTDTTGWDGVFGTIASSAVNKVFDSVVSYIKKIFDATGGGVEKAVKWAISIANDNSHGYDQANRWGNPDYDCSSLVISAFEQAGIKLKSAGATYTGNMYNAARSVGFADVTGSVNRGNGANMKRGDILLNRQNHVAMYIGDGRLVQASMNENGGITGGRPGDQTGKEISTGGYYNFPWDDVLRYSKFKNGIGKILPKDLPAFVDGGFPEDGLFMANHNEMVGQFSNGRNAVINNEQIVDGIARGVYEAVVQAQAENSREHGLLQEILEAIKAGKTISVDGRELVQIYDERKSRNGFAFT